MNSKKITIIVVVLAVLFGGYKFFTKIDHSDPVAVATAFTKAYKAQNTSKASLYMLPDKAEEWRTSVDNNTGKLKSGAMRAYFENIPATPVFAEAVPVKGAAALPAGTMMLQSSDKTLTLEMSRLEGKWYVSKAPM